VDEVYNDIRPYRDHEVEEAMKRLEAHESFHQVLRYVNPGLDAAGIHKMLEGVHTIDDFQRLVAHPAMRGLVDTTCSELTSQGFENLRSDGAHLFISNHRDIILDSAILNMLLLEHGFPTTETAIGNNLLSSELITDLTRLNKNFVVKRNTAAREFYDNSLRLSGYIRHTITERNVGIWIAQREGRTKNGLDKTQPGLLKMLSIGCDDPLRFCFRSLRIVPVAISYEYDPCDVLKIPELKAVSRDERYEKKPDEDYRSILTGLTGSKGRVHLGIGRVIDKELDILADFQNVNDKLRLLGEIIDRQIFSLYKLWPTNYMANDLLNGTRNYTEEYSDADITAFEQRIRERLHAAGLHADEDFEFLLMMYANPVENAKSASV
jgi:hypothetical protein